MIDIDTIKKMAYNNQKITDDFKPEDRFLYIQMTSIYKLYVNGLVDVDYCKYYTYLAEQDYMSLKNFEIPKIKLLIKKAKQYIADYVENGINGIDIEIEKFTATEWQTISMLMNLYWEGAKNGNEKSTIKNHSQYAEKHILRNSAVKPIHNDHSTK